MGEGKRSVLEGVPKALPALIKAMRLNEKAAQVGFVWETTEQVWEKVKEEEAELQQAIAAGEPKEVEGEFGDLLFSLVNYSRFLKIDAEAALEGTNKKFMYRFKEMETMAAEMGKGLHEMNLEEMDGLWNRIKQNKG